MSESERICSRCGRPIPADLTDCPCQLVPVSAWPLERETTLLLSVGVLILLFVVTGVIARLYHTQRTALADEWFRRGEAALAAGRPQAAIEDFRTALVYARRNDAYDLRLAQGLVAAHRTEEARSYLLGLWDRSPGSGVVNLELARLAAEDNDVPGAIQHYHDAIYGAWPEKTLENRRAARLEMSGFLLGIGSKEEALGELIALAAGLPPEAPIHVQVGSLMLQAGGEARALREFQEALRYDHSSLPALAGAGRAAYQLGNYRLAEQYLERVVKANPHDVDSVQLLETSRLVLQLDPFEGQLSDAQRAQRVRAAFDLAWNRLAACARQRGENLQEAAPQTPLQKVWAQANPMRKQVRGVYLQRHPEQFGPLMTLVFEMEGSASQICGAPAGPDLALQVIAQRHGTPAQ